MNKLIKIFSFLIFLSLIVTLGIALFLETSFYLHKKRVEPVNIYYNIYRVVSYDDKNYRLKVNFDTIRYILKGNNYQKEKVLSMDKPIVFYPDNFEYKNNNLIVYQNFEDKINAKVINIKSKKIEEIEDIFTKRIIISSDNKWFAYTIPGDVLDSKEKISDNGNFIDVLAVRNNLNNQIIYIKKKDLPLKNNVGNSNLNFIYPLSFSSNNNRLYFSLVEGGGDLGTQNLLFYFDLESKEIKLLINNEPKYDNLGRLRGHLDYFLRESGDGKSIFLMRVLFDDNINPEKNIIVKYNLLTGKTVSLSDNFYSYYGAENIRPDGKGIVIDNPNRGFSFYSFETKQAVRLQNKGKFLGWSKDGKAYSFIKYNRDFFPDLETLYLKTTNGLIKIYQSNSLLGDYNNFSAGDTFYSYLGID